MLIDTISIDIGSASKFGREGQALRLNSQNCSVEVNLYVMYHTWPTYKVARIHTLLSM